MGAAVLPAGAGGGDDPGGAGTGGAMDEDAREAPARGDWELPGVSAELDDDGQCNAESGCVMGTYLEAVLNRLQGELSDRADRPPPSLLPMLPSRLLLLLLPTVATTTLGAWPGPLRRRSGRKQRRASSAKRKLGSSVPRAPRPAPPVASTRRSWGRCRRASQTGTAA